MQVEVYADIACAWCRLGTERLRRAVAAVDGKRDIELVYRPYQLDPDASAEPQPLLETMAELFGRDQADAMATEMTRLGATEGIEYRFDRAVAVNTFDAHRLLWLVLRDHQPQLQATVATALFDAQFRDGINVADGTQLGDVAARAGVERDRVNGYLASDKASAEVRREVTAAKEGGVTSVPTFVFEGGEQLSGAVSTEALTDVLHRVN